MFSSYTAVTVHLNTTAVEPDGCYGFAVIPPITAVLFSSLRDGGLQVKDLIRETPEMAPVLSLSPFSLSFLEIQPKAY